ncbi:MAG TPA: type II secretion system protein N [Gammaproteobacteria bacterium]|nr:type II secretion system protein N [Gammaproteobacteria bacterium]
MVCIVFCLLIVHAGMGLLHTIRMRPTVKTPVISTAKASPHAFSPEALARKIAGQHLFGKVAQEPTPATKPEEQSSTPVKLVGIIYSGSATERSMAIFVIQGRQQSYSSGATLPNGDLVSAIRSNEVILKGSRGQYSVLLRHPNKDLLTHAPHFELAADNGISTVQITGPAPVQPKANAAPPATIPTLKRLRTLRAKLLGGGRS